MRSPRNLRRATLVKRWFLIGLVFASIGTASATFTPSSSAEFYYNHPDHLGSTTVMTDRNGNLVKHYEYKAYGNDRFVSAPTPVIASRYTGHERPFEQALLPRITALPP